MTAAGDSSGSTPTDAVDAVAPAAGGGLEPLGATLSVAVAGVGFALAGPTGLLAAVVVGAAVVLPWPLPFALGQVAAAVVFGDPAAAEPLVPFVLAQGGLWLALATSLARTRRDPLPLLAGGGTALALVAAASGVLPGTDSLDVAAVVVAVGFAGVLYAVHRYERVAAGLVEE